MGQSEVLEFLNKQERPFSLGEIANALGECSNKISHILRKLLKHNEIKCIEIDRNKVSKIITDYKIFRRIRLYYCFEKQRINFK